MSDVPSISVVMSVRNGERFLREAVDSVLSQSEPDFEFVVLDDGSTDSTAEILASYEDTRMRVTRNAETLGLAASLNRGIERARGQFIARMDGDDVCEPERFARQLAVLRERPDVAVVGTEVTPIDGMGNPMPERNAPSLPRSAPLVRWTLARRCCLRHPSVMMRKNAFTVVGGYNPDYTSSQDYDLWMRMSETMNLINLPDALLRYRYHEDSVTLAKAGEQRLNEYRARAEGLRRRTGVDVPDAWGQWLVAPGEIPSANDARALLGALRALWSWERDRDGVLAPEVRRDAAQWVASIGKSLARRFPMAALDYALAATAISPGAVPRLIGAWLSEGSHS